MITNVFKALRGNPALNHDNNIHEYDIYVIMKISCENVSERNFIMGG